LKRYGSVKLLLADLRRFLSRHLVEARQGGAWRGPLLWCRRKGRALAVAAAVVLGVLGPALWDVYRDRAAWSALAGPDADPGEWAAAERHFAARAERRPHDSESAVALALAGLRAGETDRVVQALEPPVSAADRGWLGVRERILALAHMRAGRFGTAWSLSEWAASRGAGGALEWRLGEELGTLFADGDLIARCIDAGNARAVGHAAGLQATPELVRALILYRAGYVNPDDRGRAGASEALRDSIAAHQALTQLAPTGPGTPGRAGPSAAWRCRRPPRIRWSGTTPWRPSTPLTRTGPAPRKFAPPLGR
jgi:hypothetical protein